MYIDHHVIESLNPLVPIKKVKVVTYGMDESLKPEKWCGRSVMGIDGSSEVSMSVTARKEIAMTKDVLKHIQISGQTLRCR